jgi:hypothetical protein
MKEVNIYYSSSVHYSLNINAIMANVPKNDYAQQRNTREVSDLFLEELERTNHENVRCT